MARVSQEQIDEIINKNDIVEVIGERIEVFKKGKSYSAVCPFHDDTNPSLVISQERQNYKCFACGAYGNTLDFVRNIETPPLEFLEALKILADRVGIPLDVSLTHTSNENVVNENKDYYELNTQATQLFSYLINESNDDKLEAFLKQRNLTKEIIDYFKIGYNSNDNVLTKLFMGKNLDLNKAVDLDLLKIYHNDYIDNYTNRVIYPISDIYDRIVGFSARTIINDERKYINTNSNPIFHKSSILYNINNAKDVIKQTKQVYICEGPNDVIAFYKAGILNVVGIMGTAFTQEHVSVLRNLNVEKVILALDGDNAGIKAAHKILTHDVTTQFQFSVVDFEGLDPDDYFNKVGSEAFVKKVTNSTSYLEFMINYVYQNTNLHSYDDKKKAIVNLTHLINQSNDKYDITFYTNMIMSKFDVSKEMLDNYVDTNRPVQPVSKPITEDDYFLDKASKIALFFMITDIEKFDLFKKESITFVNKRYRRLYNAISAYYLEYEHFDLNQFAAMGIEQEVIEEIKNLLLQTKFEEFGDDKVFKDSITNLRIAVLMSKKEQVNQKVKLEIDPIKKSDLLLERQVIEEEIKKLRGLIFS